MAKCVVAKMVNNDAIANTVVFMTVVFCKNRGFISKVQRLLLFGRNSDSAENIFNVCLGLNVFTICPCCLYFSFASPKRKVTKEKAIFGQRLRRPKKALRCYVQLSWATWRWFFAYRLLLLSFLHRLSFRSLCNRLIPHLRQKKAPSGTQLHLYYH